MGALLAMAIGILVAAAVYLFLARDLPRLLIGFVLLGTAANLLIFAAGRLGGPVPPIVGPGADALAAGASNPLPQALVLTAIVIGFGLTAFALMLVMKSYGEFGTASAEEICEAEGEMAPSAECVAQEAPEREAA